MTRSGHSVTVNRDSSVFVATTGVLVTLLFVWVGLAMWHDPPSDADAAVGKGLLAFAAAAGILTTVYVADLFDRENAAKNRAQRTRKPSAAPSDWDDS
jgi:hypothetical protein